MNDLTTFTNPEFGQVRTVEIDGTPWLSTALRRCALTAGTGRRTTPMATTP